MIESTQREREARYAAAYLKVVGATQATQWLGGQVGGTHYTKLKIQPIEYVHANNLGYCEGSVIKYVSRWRDKGGLEDLRKAKHFIDILIELETRGEAATV